MLNMLTSYKFWYVERLDNVHISECAVRLYEGEITTQDEPDLEGDMKPVTRYRKSKTLTKEDLSHFSDRETRKDAYGKDVLIFTDADFGVISTDDELRTFLNKELKKDKTRSPVPEQEDNDEQ